MFDIFFTAHAGLPFLSRIFLTSLVLVLSTPAPGEAQDLPSAVLLRTDPGQGLEDGSARGFDRVLRQRLDALGVVRIAGSVELSLEDVQLALGCIGESEPCLRAVAEEAGGAILLFASIDRSGESIVVSVLRFDTRDGSLRRAVRTVENPEAALESAEQLVRELWGLPPSEPERISNPSDPVIPAPITPGLSPWPLVLIGVGVASLAGGAIALGVGFDDRSGYANARPTTTEEADLALAQLDRAQAELLAGSVLLVVGGAVVTAGLGWVLGAGREDGSSPLAIVPTFSHEGGGVVLAGSFSGGSH